jgi:hypothetical protein
MNDAVTSVNRYQVKPECLDDFLKVIDQHAALLRDLELITDREAEVLVGNERETGRPLVVEIFDWSDESASQRAHTHPQVSGIWEAMGPLCEARGDRGPFEFANLRRLDR